MQYQQQQIWGWRRRQGPKRQVARLPEESQGASEEGWKLEQQQEEIGRNEVSLLTPQWAIALETQL